jgi:hypothetical protein
MLNIAGLLSLGTLFSTELSFSGIISLPPSVIVHPFPPLKTDYLFITLLYFIHLSM